MTQLAITRDFLDAVLALTPEQVVGQEVTVLTNSGGVYVGKLVGANEVVLRLKSKTGWRTLYRKNVKSCKPMMLPKGV
jgi:hypothetical protein